MLGSDVGLYCLEVGKGASAAIIEPIPRRSSPAYQATIVDVGEQGVKLAQWLRDLNIERIPAILLTHNDADHIGSLVSLVQAFKGKIGKLRLVVDRKKELPFWIPIQEWVRDGWIQDADILGAPLAAQPGVGETVVGPGDGVGFTLRCTYPPRLFGIGFLGLWDSLVKLITTGTNQLSAVLRLSPSNDKNLTLALFGGDLDYKGWKYLVDRKYDLRTKVFLIPHHGGPQRAAKKFGPTQLAQATTPSHSLISVGTHNNDRHPHEDLIVALRSVGSHVFCTQITQQCLPVGTLPSSLANDALLVRTAHNYCLSPNGGSACAGTIIVVFDVNGPVIRRRNAHQAEVNRISAGGHTPLCRK